MIFLEIYLGDSSAWEVDPLVVLAEAVLEDEEDKEEKTHTIPLGKFIFQRPFLQTSNLRKFFSGNKGIVNHYFYIYRVSLEDLYNGKTSKLQLSRTIICKKCKG